MLLSHQDDVGTRGDSWSKSRVQPSKLILAIHRDIGSNPKPTCSNGLVRGEWGR